MSNSFRDQLYNRLNQKESDELVQIWQTNDRVEWTEMAFDVIREILLERLDQLPPQNEPIFEHTKQSSDSEEDDLEEMVAETESQPVFYEPKQVLWLNKWIHRTAVVSIILIAIGNLFYLPTLQRTAWSYFMNPDWEAGAWVIALLVWLIGVTLEGLLLYFPLKALAYILRILMEMEFNSRSAGITAPQSPQKANL